MSIPALLRLERVDKGHLAQAGGKGANLGEIMAAGFPVPPAFVVTVACGAAFLRESKLDLLIAKHLDCIQGNRPAALTAAVAPVLKAFEAARMSPGLAAAILEEYETLGAGPVAVRSSALAEDSAEASFAGAQSTFLDVVGRDALLEAVKACWASQFRTEAVAYRAMRGLPLAGTGMAVVIQRMAQATLAGVIFTCDPVTNASDRMLIQAVSGLGESLVSGEASPQSYWVEKASLQGSFEPLDHQLQQAELLDGPTLKELALLGRRLEEHYGHPQDVEWAIEAGHAFILQSRPITTLGDSVVALKQGLPLQG